MSKGTWERIKDQGVKGLLRLIVLICSLVLIGVISYDTFVYNNPFYQSEFAEKVQFWVCIFFMVDLALEFILSKRKARYITTYSGRTHQKLSNEPRYRSPFIGDLTRGTF